jgi:hypothetical protein
MMASMSYNHSAVSLYLGTWVPRYMVPKYFIYIFGGIAQVSSSRHRRPPRWPMAVPLDLER